MIAFAPATPADIPLSQRLAREIWHEHYLSIMDDHRMMAPVRQDAMRA